MPSQVHRTSPASIEIIGIGAAATQPFEREFDVDSYFALETVGGAAAKQREILMFASNYCMLA